MRRGCGARSVVVVTSLMTYVTGTIGYKWRKAHHSGG